MSDDTAGRMRSVRPALVGDQVYELLEHEILTGGLPGGARMRVRQLAEMAGTSVMPVRDAIRRLEEAGLVEHRPHRGAVVKSFETAELIEIYSVRVLLEPEAARQGAARIGADELRSMRELTERIETALEAERFIDALGLHSDVLRILYTAGGNALLLELIEMLWKRSAYYRLTVAERTRRLTMGDRDRAMLRAAERGDPDEVAEQIAAALDDALVALVAVERGDADGGA